MQMILSFIRENFSLLLFMGIGFMGFIMVFYSDMRRNAYKKLLIEASACTKIDKEPPALPSDPGHFCMTLNIAGLILLLASLASLFMGGYFDPYIGFLFGR